MMMDVDQAAKAMKEAEIEDLLEGFNQPTTAPCGSMVTWSPRDGWSGDDRPGPEWLQ
jgi:hypothetical protein